MGAHKTEPLYLVPEEGAENPLDPAEVRKPWERLPRETDHDWAYFSMYLESAYPEGPAGKYQPRNVSELARRLGVARETLAQRSAGYHWVQRAGAWDREVERRRKDANLGEVQRTQEAHLRIARKLRNLCEAEVDKLQAKSLQDPTLPVLTGKDLVQMMTLAVQMETKAVGGTAAKGVAGEGDVDLERLDLADLETLYEITQRAKA